MEKRKTAFKTNKNYHTKNKIYAGQTIEMQRYVDFVWFIEYTDAVIEAQKNRMYESGNVEIKSKDIGVMITAMEMELVQMFTNVDLTLMDYSEMINSDFLDSIVWAFENYEQVLKYFMNALQLFQIQTLFIEMTSNLPDLEDLMGDMSKASQLLNDMPDDQKELLMNIQLNKMIHEQLGKEKELNKEEQSEVVDSADS